MRAGPPRAAGGAHRAALGGRQAGQQPDERLRALAVQARGRLVQEQHARVGDQADADAHAPPLAAADAADRAIDVQADARVLAVLQVLRAAARGARSLAVRGPINSARGARSAGLRVLSCRGQCPWTHEWTGGAGDPLAAPASCSAHDQQQAWPLLCHAAARALASATGGSAPACAQTAGASAQPRTSSVRISSTRCIFSWRGICCGSFSSALVTMASFTCAPRAPRLSRACRDPRRLPAPVRRVHAPTPGMTGECCRLSSRQAPLHSDSRPCPLGLRASSALNPSTSFSA